MNLSESVNGNGLKNRQKITRELTRLLASNTCFLCLNPEIEHAEFPDVSICFTSKIQARLVERAVDFWQPCLLPSPATGEGNIPLTPLEALILKTQITFPQQDRVNLLTRTLEHKQEAGVQLPENFLNFSKLDKEKIREIFRKTTEGTKFKNLLLLNIIKPE